MAEVSLTCTAGHTVIAPVQSPDRNTSGVVVTSLSYQRTAKEISLVMDHELDGKQQKIVVVLRLSQLETALNHVVFCCLDLVGIT